MEKMINEYKNLFCKISGHYTYDTDSKALTFDARLNSYDVESLNDVFSEERRGKSIVSKENLPFSYFDNLDEFISEVNIKDLERDVVIANYKNSVFVYLVNENKSYKDFELYDCYLITNTRAFFQSKVHFEKQTELNVLEFEFVDFYSESARKITFSSLIDKKKVVFIFPKAGVIKLNENLDYEKSYNDFIAAFNADNNTFPIFLKKSLISNLYLETENTYCAFFDKLDKIIKEAKLNFNVYLHELSFEDMKKEYEEYKVRFFKEQTEILSKLSTQILALPISLAGTMFAVYNLKETVVAVVIVIVGLALFLLYTSYIVFIYKNDISRLNKEIAKDYNKLQQHKFFIKHKEELIDFKESKDWLVKRANNLRKGLISYSVILWILNLSVMVYSYYMYFCFEFNAMFIIIVACLIILTIVANIALFAKSKELN